MSIHRPGRGSVGILSCLLSLLAGFALVFLTGVEARAMKPGTEHLVYFRHTPYELNIYKIRGAEPGPTLMIIGGIQGNEPGGFLSADLYADMALRRGNLIVVPRANFNSILHFSRGINGDMNRKFDQRSSRDIEDKIVEILKRLIAESDCLLNLHEGSGFYSPRWESPRVNPMRFGQSIIADASRYYAKKRGQWLELEKMAARILAKVNPQIRVPRYRFRFNNHRTGDPDTLHPEQRKSATYYALTSREIPAFGIETSKDIPNTEVKVRHHTLIINAFMEELGIEPETPPVHLEPPRLAYLVIAVNDGLPVVVRPNQTLTVRPGDRIEVVHIEANYKRGLSADILGLGSLCDQRTSFVIRRSTQIVARKDHQECGRIKVAVSEQPEQLPAAKPPMPVRAKGVGFFVRINGTPAFYGDGDRVFLVKGDHFEVVDVSVPKSIRAPVKVNVKGFMANPANNTGEDRGYLIDTAKDMLRRHSLRKQGRHYLVLVQAGSKVVGKLHLLIAPPRLRYLAACIDGSDKRWFLPGEVIQVHQDQTLQVMDIQTTVPPGEPLSLNCEQGPFDLGSKWREKVLRFDKLHPLSAEGFSFSWQVRRRDITVGTLTVRVLPAGSGPWAEKETP